MPSIKVLSVVGARPNFMKVAPLHRAFTRRGDVDSRIVHTGQHYDARMSDVFFRQLGLPQPHHYLGVGGGSHAVATANVMTAFEPVLREEDPTVVLVVGDVNSTIACALVAAKLHYPIVHVEAGLRSGDRSMPEEINRVCTDAISDHLFVTEQSGMVNLAREGVPEARTHFVGHVMIDSLRHYLRQTDGIDVAAMLTENAVADQALPPTLPREGFVLSTMHRPSNVDHAAGLEAIAEIFDRIADHRPIVFPIHPRTRRNATREGLLQRWLDDPRLILTEPLGYLQFVSLLRSCKAVVTDSGGIQEETTYLRKPCFTFRDSTERPVTVTLGTNVLMPSLDPDRVLAHYEAFEAGQLKTGVIPPLWDGHASERIAEILHRAYAKTGETETATSPLAAAR